MRTTAHLFRWGLTSLLLAPVAFVAFWATGGTIVLAVVAFLLIVLGGALNALAIVLGARKIGSRGLFATMDGYDPTESRVPAEPIAPRQRIIFPDGAEPLSASTTGTRRELALGSAAALAGLVALGAWALAIEQPLAIGQGQLTLDEVYGYWGAASRIAFTTALAFWVVLSGFIALGVAALGLLRSEGLDRFLTPLRMLAAACVAASVIVTAWSAPAFVMGLSLPDAMPFGAGGAQGIVGQLYVLLGFAFSATAILLTVPDWRRRVR